MKHSLYTLIIFLILVIILGCKKDEGNDLTEDNLALLTETDKDAFLSMQSAYTDANNYNDSLIFCDHTPNNCSEQFIHYCDSLYHYHDSMFNYYHHGYTHENEHCDHFHDGYGIHHHGNHHNHNYSQGHHEHDHDLMDELRQQHQYYHP